MRTPEDRCSLLSFNSVFRLLMFFLLAIQAGVQHASAQPGRYNGPAIDLERTPREPSAYSECNRFTHRNGREASACSFGADEARRVAIKYSGGYGYMHGFLKGFSWGLNRMANVTANDFSAISEGALAVNGMRSHMNSGLQSVRQQGELQGQAAGSNLAIERFIYAVDTGRPPSPRFTVPPVSYGGEDNGYARFVARDGARSPRQILKEELSPMNSHMRAYDGMDTVFVGDVPRLSIWDAWHDDGIYSFEKRQWLEPDSAFGVWLARPTDTKSKYNELNKPPLTEPVPNSRERAATERRRQNAGVIDLQQIFKSAFIEAYRHYAPYYFSHEFYRALDEGQMRGELVGIELGRRLAYQKGMIRAFDAEFKERSEVEFRSAYESAFRAAFEETFDDYAANAKLDIEFTDVLGTVHDGIIQPGEVIGVSFRVRNSGGQATSVHAALSGDVIDVQPLTLGDIPALTTKTYRTAAMAAINPRLHTGADANLILRVNGKEISRSERIMTPIQIAGRKTEVAAMSGAARATVAIRNISTMRGAGEVNVNLIVPGKSVVRSLGAVEAGETKEAELDISGLDTLDLIKGIDAGIQVTMDGRLMSDDTVRIIPADVKLELAAFFDQLVKQAGVKTPANAALPDRTAEVERLIADKNLADVSEDNKDNLWKENRLSTMLGLLVRNLKSVDQTAATRKSYAQLGQALWEHRKKLGKVLFFKSSRRKDYESLCEELMQRK